MQFKKYVPPFIITCLVIFIFCIFYVPTFAINDDVMIESIMSGSFFRVYPYTFYFSAPLGIVISSLYHLKSDIPWFGIFIMVVNACSIFAIEHVVCNRLFNGLKKIIAICFSLSFIVCLHMAEIALPHYTVAAATIGAAGLVLFITATNEKQFIVPIIFFILTYLIRENVFYMMLPFVGIAFIYLLLENKERDIKKYCIYALFFLAVSIAAIILNKVLVSSEEWRSYKAFNNIRTEVYDYVGIPEDEAAFRYYDSVDISRSDIELIKSYNIMLGDLDKIQNELEIIADYSANRHNESGYIAKIKEAVVAYKYRLINEKTDNPYNYILILAYALLILCVVIEKQYIYLIPISLLGVYGRIIWIYLFFKGRYPERVTMSLYILEITLLVAMILRILSDVQRKGGMLGISRIVGISIMMSLFILFCMGSIKAVNRLNIEYEKVRRINEEDDLMYTYISNHSDKFYFIDVYTTVSRTKPIFEKNKNSDSNYYLQNANGGVSFSENYMILGGWMIKHPLYMEKLNYILNSAKTDTICDALMKENRINIITRDGTSATMEQLAKWVGTEADIVDIVESGDKKFYVYSFAE